MTFIEKHFEQVFESMSAKAANLTVAEYNEKKRYELALLICANISSLATYLKTTTPVARANMKKFDLKFK